MSAALTASFTLRLVDQFAGPLRALQQQFQSFKELAGSFDMGGLRQATGGIQQTTRATRELAQELGGVRGFADEGGKALTGMAERGRSALTALRREWSQFTGGGSAGADLGPGFAEWAKGKPFKRGRVGDWDSGPRWSGAHPGGAPDSMDDTLAAVGAGGLIARMFAGLERSGDLDNILRHEAIYSGLSGPAVDQFVADHFRSYSRLALATARPSEDIFEAGRYLNQSHLGQDAQDLILNQSARAATAFNSNATDVAKLTFGLHELLQIPTDQLQGAVGAFGAAATMQHFDFSDFATLFPMGASPAALQGVRGTGGAQDLAAMLVAGRSGFATSGETATGLENFASDLNERSVKEKFKKFGVDLDGVLVNARKLGADPLEEVLRAVVALRKAHPEQNVVGDLFQRLTAQQFVGQLVTHFDDYLAAKAKIAAEATPTLVDEKFRQALPGLISDLRRFKEEADQLDRRMSLGLRPEMNAAGWAMRQLGSAFDGLDSVVPGASNVLFGAGAAFVSLVAGAGAWKLLGGPLKASFSLIGSALRTTLIQPTLWAGSALLDLAGGSVVTAGVLGATFATMAAAASYAAYDIYENWGKFEPFFDGMGTGLARIATGIGQTFSGLWQGDMTEAYTGILNTWSGLTTFFQNLFATLTQLVADFDRDFGTHIQHAMSRIGTLQGIKANIGEGATTGNDLGLGPEANAAASPELKGEISITLHREGGWSIDPVSNTPGVRFTTRSDPDTLAERRGQTLNRP